MEARDFPMQVMKQGKQKKAGQEQEGGDGWLD